LRVRKIDHVGVAVRDKESAERFLTDVLGARKRLDEPWTYRGQEFNWSYYDVGGQGRIELISSTDPNSFINRYIDKYGEGLHHVTILVEDISEAVSSLEKAGIEVLDLNTENPHWKEAYISPRVTFGVLFQLAECDDSYWGLD
jgi:methylmalonyl-CoA/ethylmalonyl-CoA epimerase